VTLKKIKPHFVADYWLAAKVQLRAARQFPDFADPLAHFCEAL